MKIDSKLYIIGLAISLTACQTTTRFGDIVIPAHPNSYKAKDEKVKVTVEKIADVKPLREEKKDQEGEKSLSSLGLIAAKWLAGEAQKKVAEEIRNEAKKYTQQYSGKYRGSLAPGIYEVVMQRMIPEQRTLAGVDTSSMITASAVKFHLTIENSASAATATVAALDLKEIHLNKAKAKVVGISGWPWQWLGTLLLKTGDVVKVEVHATVRGLTEKGFAIMLDTDFPAGGQKMKLKGAVIEQGDTLGDWMLLGKNGSKVPLSIEIRVTESDPSNVQKTLNDNADKVEKSTFLQDLVTGG